MDAAADQASLKSARFRREREDSWRALERIIATVHARGFRKLGAEELQQLPVLYRGAVSSLSVARAISLDRALLEYLEGLVSRAYVVVYTDKRPVRDLVSEFFAARFPCAVREIRRPALAAAALLVLGIACGFFLTMADTSRYASFVSAQLAQGRTPEASDETLREALYTPPGERGGLTFFASYLFTHNAKVGVMCFCLGFLAGAPVVILLFYNGLMLGAMTALYWDRGMGAEFLAWLAGHGVTELTAVVLCGGAGLVLARAMLFPGRRTRAGALAAAGRLTAPVVVGAIAMFFVAGLLEGYFRQLVSLQAARWGVAALTAVLWGAYFCSVGPRPGTAREDPS